uniref:Envelope glycoprotein n=1 Tax=Nothobranchius furzeri TaxID=105023 RepID=A0A8C6KDE4_NOTFU
MLLILLILSVGIADSFYTPVSYYYANSEKQTPLLSNFSNPCREKGQGYSPDPYFCYNGTRTDAKVIFNLADITVGGYKGNIWEGYDWYLDSSGGPKTHGPNWGEVFATTGSWARGSYGYTERAQKWSKRMSMVLTSRQIIIHLNTTVYPIEPPTKRWSATHDPPCHAFTLCVWRPNAVDPCTRFGLSPNFTTTSARVSSSPPKPVNKMGVLTHGPRTGSISTVSLINGNPTADEWFQVTTGISGFGNNWLLMVEQAASAAKQSCVFCMGSRPLLQIAPANLDPTCMLPVMTSTNPTKNCSFWDEIYPVTGPNRRKPCFSSKVAKFQFTCVNITGKGPKWGRLNKSWCSKVVKVSVPFKPVPRADIWWWCGDNRLFDKFPMNVTGTCALVSPLLPVSVYPTSAQELVERLSSVIPGQWKHRTKRDVTWQGLTDPTYIDAIGVPRGVPDEYKLVDHVAAGFESSLYWWCTINKNVDRINYIHFSVQRLGNWTQSGFEAVHGQLATTSLMAFQNRIALDMILAEKGGVCIIFGEECCSFVPNNTAADGSLTVSLEGLRTLNGKMKEHSGVDMSMWDSMFDMFGKYRTLVSSVLVSLAVFADFLTLYGCCCIPCI